MSKNCVQLQDLDSDLGCSDNTGGIIKVAAFYHDDVRTWPTEPEAPATLAEAGKLVGDLILKEGKRASLITLPQNKGSFAITEQGEMGGMSHQYELSLFQNGITPEMLGLMGATKNAKMGFVVVDSNGQMYLMGDKDVGAMRDKGDGATTGTARTDLRSGSVKFIYPVNNPRVFVGDFDSLLKPVPGDPKSDGEI